MGIIFKDKLPNAKTIKMLQFRSASTFHFNFTYMTWVVNFMAVTFLTLSALVMKNVSNIE